MKSRTRKISATSSTSSSYASYSLNENMLNENNPVEIFKKRPLVAVDNNSTTNNGIPPTVPTSIHNLSYLSDLFSANVFEAEDLSFISTNSDNSTSGKLYSTSKFLALNDDLEINNDEDYNVNQRLFYPRISRMIPPYSNSLGNNFKKDASTLLTEADLLDASPIQHVSQKFATSRRSSTNTIPRNLHDHAIVSSITPVSKPTYPRPQSFHAQQSNTFPRLDQNKSNKTPYTMDSGSSASSNSIREFDPYPQRPQSTSDFNKNDNNNSNNRHFIESSQIDELNKKIVFLESQLQKLQNYTMEIAKSDYKKLVNAIVIIQKVWRGYAVRKRYPLRTTRILKRRPNYYLDSDQVHLDLYTGGVDRVKTYEEFKVLRCVLFAQKIARGWIVRNRLAIYWSGLESAVKIQSLWRGYSYRKKLGPLFRPLVAKLSLHSLQIRNLNFAITKLKVSVASTPTNVRAISDQQSSPNDQSEILNSSSAIETVHPHTNLTAIPDKCENCTKLADQVSTLQSDFQMIRREWRHEMNNLRAVLQSASLRTDVTQHGSSEVSRPNSPQSNRFLDTEEIGSGNAPNAEINSTNSITFVQKAESGQNNNKGIVPPAPKHAPPAPPGKFVNDESAPTLFKFKNLPTAEQSTDPTFGFLKIDDTIGKSYLKDEIAEKSEATKSFFLTRSESLKDNGKNVRENLRLRKEKKSER
ncbi:hypothetical protein HK098_004496 [Nowakowskiella sp. JEL0407]|nr:hypothetical protein HK098_004496 [Nowakowskiella sp. JEL0407]